MLLKCLYYLGLRNAEARELLIRDIDGLRRMVKVGEGKRERQVPIPGNFGEELLAFSQGREGFLFEGRSRGQISDRHIRRIVKESAVKASIREAGEVHPHTLRHSYAAHLQSSGVPLNVIQAILGHQRKEATAIYTRAGLEKSREWVEHAFSREKK